MEKMLRNFFENQKTSKEYQVKRKLKTLSYPQTIWVEMQMKNYRLSIAIVEALVTTAIILQYEGGETLHRHQNKNVV